MTVLTKLFTVLRYWGESRLVAIEHLSRLPIPACKEGEGECVRWRGACVCEMEGEHVRVGWRGSMYMWDGEGGVGVCDGRDHV